jgi:hypothetical protein
MEEVQGLTQAAVAEVLLDGVVLETVMVATVDQE